MSYSAEYTDENGKVHTISINDAHSREAIVNDYKELMKTYNPQLVHIERLQTKPGEMLHLKITTLAPSHYLESTTDENPKPCSSMSAHVVLYLGYPLKAISAYYDPDHYLASPNVFRSGKACIDKWVPMTSSLLSVARKLILDMIHSDSVTLYNSPANSSMIQWHQQGNASGIFPTIPPERLFAAAPRTLPPRRPRPAAVGGGLPRRRH